MPEDIRKPRTGSGPPPTPTQVSGPTHHATVPGGVPVVDVARTAGAGDDWRRAPSIVTAASLQPSSTVGRNPFLGGADRAPRARVAVPVRCKYNSILEFHDTQSVNISRSGMFVATDSPAPVGSMVEFEFALDDGFILLKGSGEVVRAVTSGDVRGMGIRFDDIDEKTRKLIDRIVEVNIEEGRSPTVPSDFINLSSPTPVGGVPIRSGSKSTETIAFGDDNKLKLVLSPATVSYFTYNPLLNVRMGGFVVPASHEVPLGTVLETTIEDVDGNVLAAGKGKVVAKQELRVGIRMADLTKDVLAKLQAEVSRISPATK